eukprot:CAMPEP_0185202484 /NCGR_PEP_ID=MMETSP1140-20130426/51179_1 /TAXON_ID=298111 /ORGANISM="Pavlova sp., Strain CCMP459" /LENGTH=157 /DNA_ID=CAMNT_0027769921 /DNA_START=237 /DNA_END=710 /DNA_ORIENTATION=+
MASPLQVNDGSDEALKMLADAASSQGRMEEVQAPAARPADPGITDITISEARELARGEVRQDLDHEELSHLVAAELVGLLRTEFLRGGAREVRERRRPEALKISEKVRRRHRVGGRRAHGGDGLVEKVVGHVLLGIHDVLGADVRRSAGEVEHEVLV